jgi:hypothetical protein
VVCEAGHELVEVGAGEAPVEGLCDLVVVVLEVVQGAGEVGEVVEVVGCEQFSLDDREGDLDLDVWGALTRFRVLMRASHP